MAQTKQGLALVRNKETGLIELSLQLFEEKKDVRVRYPANKYKIVAFPVKFDSNGYIDVPDPSSEE